MSTEYLSYRDAAKLLGVSVATIRANVAAGLMPPPDARVSPRRPRWERSRLTEWVRQGGCGPAATSAETPTRRTTISATTADGSSASRHPGFLVFEGMDGSGKTFQAEWLASGLRRLKFDFIACRDPGGTALGDRLRSLLLTNDREDDDDSPCKVAVAPRAEALLFAASRAQLVAEKVLPALNMSQIVICDRFTLSSLAYQTTSGRLTPEAVRTINAIATDWVEPGLTLLLDVPFEVAERRIGPARDRIEARGRAYFEEVRGRYLEVAAKSPDRVRVIDGSRERLEVRADALRAIRDHADAENMRLLSQAVAALIANTSSVETQAWLPPRSID